jgi:hypothetical protein
LSKKLTKAEKDAKEREDLKEVMLKLLDLAKENKAWSAVILVLLLQASRMAWGSNKGMQALTTMLQSIVLAGYMGSVLEGETQNIVVGGMLVAGGSLAALEGVEDAYYPGKTIVEVLPAPAEAKEGAEAGIRGWFWPLFQE